MNFVYLERKPRNQKLKPSHIRPHTVKGKGSIKKRNKKLEFSNLLGRLTLTEEKLKNILRKTERRD